MPKSTQIIEYINVDEKSFVSYRAHAYVYRVID